MATVFKAYDTHLERDVAVKVIRLDQFSPERSLRGNLLFIHSLQELKKRKAAALLVKRGNEPITKSNRTIPGPAAPIWQDFIR